MASTSPGGESSNRRRSFETIPQPPATPTVGSSRACVNGVTMSPVGSTLVSRTMTIGPLARRIPMLRAAPCPRRSLVQIVSTDGPDVTASAEMVSSAAACASDGASATTTSDVPSGADARSPANARARSSGQSVAMRTTVARPVGASSSRDGTFRLAPYRTWSPSTRSAGAAGVSAKSVPRSAIFQPAASIAARSRSASAQSRPSRAVARAWARLRTSSGMKARVTGAG